MKRINLLLLSICFTGFVVLMNSCKDPCKDVDCGDNGVCMEGDCECEAGFSGINCENKDEEKTATLELKINPTFGEETIDLFEPVLNDAGQPIFELTKLYFYISDLKLDDEVAAEEIMLVDIEDDELNVGRTKIKPGDYNSITMGLGVDKRWNFNDPASFESEHPLGFDHIGNHWSWNAGYIFYKIEGNYSTKEDGVLDGGFLFHLGTDELYQNVTLDKAVSLKENETEAIVLNVDFENIFFKEGGLDLKTEFRSHGMGEQFEIGQKFVNRLIESLE